MTTLNKQISFSIWNLDTNEIEEIFMNEDDYNAMVEFEKKYQQECDERSKKIQDEEWLEAGYYE